MRKLLRRRRLTVRRPTIRLWPNDPVDTRPFRQRLADERRLEATGWAYRADHQARTP